MEIHELEAKAKTLDGPKYAREVHLALADNGFRPILAKMAGMFPQKDVIGFLSIATAVGQLTDKSPERVAELVALIVEGL